MATANRTHDHGTIQRWAEQRGGIPTFVHGTQGLLRIDFVRGEASGGREAKLDEVQWDDWFRVFDENGLEFLFSPEPDSKFFKIVSDDKADPKGHGKH